MMLFILEINFIPYQKSKDLDIFYYFPRLSLQHSNLWIT